MKKAYLNWSSGKDAAFAFYKIQQGNTIPVGKLVTTFNSEADRISMHGVRKELLERQALEIGLPVQIISLPGEVTMQEYNDLMERETEQLRKEGFTHSIFGDIFLEDLKAYREKQLRKAGFEGIFPLWKINTRSLLKEFLAVGFKAVTVCVNSRFLDSSFCGRLLDEDFLNDLPEGVDPCGENGEFHSFVYDGPIFKNPVLFEIGEVTERFYAPAKAKDSCSTEETPWDTGFWYCDLLPVEVKTNFSR